MDFSAEGAFKSHYIGFYADCEHEIKPVLSGYRLALVYNLVKTSTDGLLPSSTEINEDAEYTRISAAFNAWSCDPAAPPKMAFLLSHKYTQDGLKSPADLKGEDCSAAALLTTLQRSGLACACLVFIEKRVYGDKGDNGRAPFEQQDSEIEVEIISGLGQSGRLPKLSIDDGVEILQRRRLSDFEKDGEHNEGPTGEVFALNDY